MAVSISSRISIGSKFTEPFLRRHCYSCLMDNQPSTRKLSTYNIRDKKYPQDIMDRFLERLSKYGAGDIILDKNANTGIAVVTIDNIKRKNALTGHMMVRMKDIVEELERWKMGKAVVLRGHGDTFCSGGDLTAVMKEIGTPEEGRMMCEYMQEMLTRFMELPLVSVAALNGKTLGGGAELATACDFRLISDDAEIGFVQSKLGISTGWGGGSRLVKILGKRKALRILTTATTFSHDDAISIGLADGSLETNKDPTEACIEWLESGKYLHADAKVIQVMKQISVNADDLSLREALDIERDLFASLWGGELHKNALRKNIKHRKN
eukprot:gene15918-17519_t